MSEVCQAAKHAPSTSKTRPSLITVKFPFEPENMSLFLSSWMELSNDSTHCRGSDNHARTSLSSGTILTSATCKSVVGDQALMTETFLNIRPISLGPNTPWPNRAEAAVRLLKATLKIMLNSIKAGTAPATLKKETYRQLVKAAATVRNQTVTHGGVAPCELVFGNSNSIDD